jgi:hypothetical protein
MWKLRVETRFRRSVKRDCHETQGLRVFDNSLFKKNPIPIPKFMISHKMFSCRQQATNGRMCSPLFRKEGLIRQTIFNGTSIQWTQHDYHCQIFVSKVTLLSLSLSVALTIGSVTLQFISQFRKFLSSPYKSTTSIQYTNILHTQKKHFFTLELRKKQYRMHSSYETRIPVWPVYTKFLIFMQLLINKAELHPRAQWITIHILQTHWTMLTQTEVTHTVLPHFSITLRKLSCIKMQTVYRTNHTPMGILL